MRTVHGGPPVSVLCPECGRRVRTMPTGTAVEMYVEHVKVIGAREKCGMSRRYVMPLQARPAEHVKGLQTNSKRK